MKHCIVLTLRTQCKEHWIQPEWWLARRVPIPRREWAALERCWRVCGAVCMMRSLVCPESQPMVLQLEMREEENFQASPLGETPVHSLLWHHQSIYRVFCEFLTPLRELEEVWLLVTGTLTMALEAGFDFQFSESSRAWLSRVRSADSMVRPAAAPS